MLSYKLFLLLSPENSFFPSLALSDGPDISLNHSIFWKIVCVYQKMGKKCSIRYKFEASEYEHPPISFVLGEKNN